MSEFLSPDEVDNLLKGMATEKETYQRHDTWPDAEPLTKMDLAAIIICVAFLLAIIPAIIGGRA